MDLHIALENKTHIGVYSRDIPSQKVLVPFDPERHDETFVALHTLVLEAYAAGKRNGKEELRESICGLIGAKKQ